MWIEPVFNFFIDCRFFRFCCLFFFKSFNSIGGILLCGFKSDFGGLSVELSSWQDWRRSRQNGNLRQQIYCSFGPSALVNALLNENKNKSNLKEMFKKMWGIGCHFFLHWTFNLLFDGCCWFDIRIVIPNVSKSCYFCTLHDDQAFINKLCALVINELFLVVSDQMCETLMSVIIIYDTSANYTLCNMFMSLVVA